MDGSLPTIDEALACVDALQRHAASLMVVLATRDRARLLVTVGTGTDADRELASLDHWWPERDALADRRQRRPVRRQTWWCWVRPEADDP